MTQDSRASSRYRHGGFFVLRTPTLPVETFHQWTADGRDRERLRAGLRRFVEDPFVAEALFIASPSLSSCLRYWYDDPTCKRGRRIERSLVSYLGRMSTRSTPFGLFSGCATGSIGNESELSLAGRDEHRRIVRFDKAYLFGLCEDLRRVGSVRRKLTYISNDSLYRRGDHYRYVGAIVDRSGLTHQLLDVECSPFVDAALRCAACLNGGSGATQAELAEAIAAADPDGEVSPQDALEFAESLIENQVLVSQLTPVVTGPEPIDEILAQLARLGDPSADALHALLSESRRTLSELPEAGVGISPTVYESIMPDKAELATAMPLNLLETWPEERLFQVDLRTVGRKVTLSESLVERVLDGAEVLHRICASGRHERMDRFRRAFVERYQGREVPLLAALDEESGIDFGSEANPKVAVSPGLEGMSFPRLETQEVLWGRRTKHLYRLLCETWMAGRRELRLLEADVERMTPDVPAPLPDALSVAATLVGSPAGLRSGRVRAYIHNLDGPSGARPLGRFCHVDDTLREAVVRHLEAEEALRPEVAFAEIVHQPQGRMLNVVCRPVLRRYELPYLGRSGVGEEFQLPVDDLMVSVVGDRIRLWSKRLEREVVPRMTNAHNPGARPLGMYKFLAALQSQDNSGGATWNWGPLSDAPFLPRVTYRSFIFSLAQWRVPSEKLRPLRKLGATARFEAMDNLRRQRGLPRTAAVTTLDQYVPIDLENELCVDALVRMAGQHDDLLLREMLIAPDDLCVQSPDGLLTHEIILPFVRASEATEGADATEAVAADASSQPGVPAAANSPAASELRCTFLPGSEWFEAVVYCSEMTADRILRQLTAAVGDTADVWFFSRHFAPSFHLRVRLHAADGAVDELLRNVHRISTDLVNRGEVYRLAVDTYARDVARLGGAAAIELVEQLFWIDSECVLDVAACLEAAEAEPERWLVTLGSCHLLLDDLDVDLQNRISLCLALRAERFRQLQGDKKLERSLGRRFRAERDALEALLGLSNDEYPLPPNVSDALRRRSERSGPIAAQLRRLVANGTLTRPWQRLVRRFLTRHLNRFVPSAQTAHDLKFYDTLHRIYSSRWARARA